jgi:hypothetical protein
MPLSHLGQGTCARRRSLLDVPVSLSALPVLLPCPCLQVWGCMGVEEDEILTQFGEWVREKFDVGSGDVKKHR